MFWHTLFLVLAIHAVALVSPGPDFAVVTRLSIVAGRRTGLWAAAGVVSSIGCYALICLTGLSLVINALPGVGRVLGVVGSLYLAWLGIQCLRSKGEMPQAQASVQGSRAYLNGLLTNLLNPKAMLYFGSILSQALGPDLTFSQAASLWAAMVAESFLWFALVASVFSAPRVLDWLKGRLVWFERAIGVILIGLAARVAASVSR